MIRRRMITRQSIGERYFGEDLFLVRLIERG